MRKWIPMRSSSTDRAFPCLTIGYGSVQSVASLAVLSKVEMNIEFFYIQVFFQCKFTLTFVFPLTFREKGEKNNLPSLSSQNEHVERDPIIPVVLSGQN